jgi:hypothetical protein
VYPGSSLRARIIARTLQPERLRNSLGFWFLVSVFWAQERIHEQGTGFDRHGE